jgi:arylsulfatase A-like enzyme/uncharacterized membrane protein YbhN (UPF0104 family)
MNKKIAFFAFKLAFISFLFIALFNPGALPLPDFVINNLPDISFSGLLDVFKSLDLGHVIFWFSFAAVVKLLGILAGIFRWHFLLKGQGISLPFWYLSKCWFMGRAIGLVLPGTVGLDGYRLVESSSYTGEVIKCTTVIAVEKLIGIVALGLLVFLTLPLGARLFDFNLVMLGIVLFILFCFITVAFLLLLNPRVAQILVTVLPVPQAIRSKVDKLGAAVTAYSGHRFTLLAAVVLGLGVHLGICLMYFGVAMGISAGESSLLDILFASPLVIVASVIAPTVSGLGVREGVFGVLLGATYGDAESVLFGHMGLWVGEAVPFLLSIPLLLIATRPDKTKFLGELEAVRKAQDAEGKVDEFHLNPETISQYRNKLIDAVGAGLSAGIIGGALLGLIEACWHMYTLQSFGESSAFWWGPMVYGIALAGAGVGIAAVLVFIYLLFDKFVPAAVTFGQCFGGTIVAVFLVFGRFRYKRDILGEQALGIVDNLIVFGIALALGAAALVGGAILAGWVKNRLAGVGATFATFIGIIGVGFVASLVVRPNVEAIEFTPTQGATGPNVILIAVDTLRADYLKAYNASAIPDTPRISELADDSVVFLESFAQSSWTKASFGTIFSGMYPEAHTAIGKVSALPDELTTIAEALEAGGYYTKGYSNNPNITSTFNYHQGYVDYTDLKPDLYFGAKPTCEKLVLYDILRKVVNVVNARRGGRITITDFYQPGNVVTDTGLEWIDGDERPANSPFFLFLHYMDPHDPFRDPDKPGKGYARVQMGNPDPDKFKEAFIRSYSYEIEFMDEHVGRLIQGLKDRGLYENSLIVFTADHGEEFHEHGGWWHGLSLYDEQIAIPLMLKLPQSEMTDLNEDLARHVDIAPTIAQIAGVVPAEKWQGKALLTPELEYANDETAYVHMHLDFEGIQLKGLRTLQRKLILANEGNKRDYAPVEFYNIYEDPAEQINIAGDSATEIELFTDNLSNMDKFIQENAAEPASLDMGNMTPEQIEQLKALGYLGDDEDEDDEQEAIEED